MNNKVLINSGNINSKVLITNKKKKYIDETEQIQWNKATTNNDIKNINRQKQR